MDMFRTHPWRLACWLLLAMLCLLRCWNLRADFPNSSPWMVDQAKFTDEGWWAQGAVNERLVGHWNVAGDYNPAVALPVWPLLLDGVFRAIGVGVVPARALAVVCSVATWFFVWGIVRQFAGPGGGIWAWASVLLLASSPFAFVFSRLAILESLVLLEFCVLVWLAARVRSRTGLLAMPVPIAVMILTKTTAALVLPALLWMTWRALDRQKRQRVSSRVVEITLSGVAVGVVPLLLVKGYSFLVHVAGFGPDYDYFYGVNAMPDVDWGQTWGTILGLFQNCIWIDRILYPMGLLALGASLIWLRRLWRNPLFVSSWLVLAAEAAFIFSRQDDYAPRYFLMMLMPLIWIVLLALGEACRVSRPAAVVGSGSLAICFGINLAMAFHFVAQPTFQFDQAARAIEQTIVAHPEQKPLVLGVSASQISLMTGIPSINDAYGTEDLARKVRRYQPGWYLAWNGVGDDVKSALGPIRLVPMGAYPVFDDDDRNRLMLFEIVRP